MIGVGRQASGFNRPQPTLLQSTSIPAPNQGIDARQPVSQMTMDHCLYTYNMIPNDNGMTTRSGYREWVTDVVSVSSNGGVRTIMVFDGLSTEPSDNRLFAVTSEGIWDVTTYDSSPVLKIAFADPTGTAGHGVYAHYTDGSGTPLMYYADSVNGLFQYEEATDLWIVAIGITGPVLANVAFVVVHKQRLWLIEQDSSVGWYLPIGSNNGSATEFFFGPKFRHGGKLLGLVNWTIDGGTGVDDYLIAVSSAGDVIPYRGEDPSVVVGTAGWTVVGTFYIGKIPAGRRFFSEFSGELYFLSSFGLISMTDLLRGVDSRDTSDSSLTFPISSLLRAELKMTGAELGWEPIFLPSAGVLAITSPLNEISGRYIQYTMSLAIEGWGITRDVPMVSIAEWDTKRYFGTLDNRVCVLDVPRDNVLLDTEAPLATGVPVKFSLLTSYTDAGSPGVFKVGQLIRPDFLTELPVSFRAKFLYDYEVAEIPFEYDSVTEGQQAVWDNAIWDESVWASGAPIGQSRLEGSGGMGRRVAIAIQGEADDTARLLSFDVSWTQGGPV